MANEQIADPGAALGEGGTLPGSTEHGGSRPLLGRMLNVSRLATIGEMAAGIAHELNQPLTAIANYAQACERLLSQPAADTGALRMALGEITGQAVRASQIIGRLRSLTRNPEMRRAPTDVNAMIDEVAALAGADARARSVRLSLDLQDGLPRAELDHTQIQHVLLNLMRNATEALAATGCSDPEVTVQSRLTPDGELELAVCDNGPGVTENIRNLVFDPFFSTKEGGTGLGLPISNSIVRAHGGTLGYRPHPPRGACFFIRLPLRPSA